MAETPDPLASGELRLIGDVLARSAARVADKTALIAPDGTISFAELDARASRFANAVLAAGIAKGEGIAIMCANRVDYVAVHFGAARTGAVLVHLHTRYTPDELAHTLEASAAKLLVLDTAAHAVYAEIADRLAHPPRLVGIGEDSLPGVEPFAGFIANQKTTAPEVEIDPRDPFCILFTGGTTGRPKAAIAPHIARLTSGTAAVEDFPIDADDVAAVTTPLYHAAGLFTWFQPCLQAGNTCVLAEKWDPAEFVAGTARHGATTAFVVPVQLAQLLDHPAFDAAKLKTLRMIAYGGAPASAALIARAEAALPGTRIVLAYGSTETGHVLCYQPEERAAKPDGLGKPGPRIEMRIFSAPGMEAPRGEVGEIATKGEHLFSGYLDDADETARYFRSGDGWGWTGDLGSMDENGVVTLTGRSKDMILSGGLNIYPAEVERAFDDHPGVAECVVFGLADEDWGELPAALVVPAPGASLDAAELLNYATGRVARHKRPRALWIVDEIPRTPGGKIQRAVLSAAYRGAAASGPGSSSAFSDA